MYRFGGIKQAVVLFTVAQKKIDSRYFQVTGLFLFVGELLRSLPILWPLRQFP